MHFRTASAGLVLSLLACPWAGAQAPAPARPPNVLFLMTDQHQASALGAAGSSVARTPNLDRLAAAGTRFPNAFCVVPYCSPTRAALLTGRYPSSLGIGRNIDAKDDPLRLRGPCDTYVQHLAAAGYSCHQLGKWHLGSPAELDCFPEARQDDEALRLLISTRNRAAGTNRFDAVARPGEAERIGDVWLNEAASAAHRRLRLEKNSPKQDVGIIGRSVVKPEFSYESILADYCIELLKRHRDEPFAITYSVSPPHPANVAPAPFYDLYDPAKLPLPATWGECPEALRACFSARMGAVYGEAGLREYLRCYYAQVTMMDECIGRILKALDELGLAGRTLVIFTSDHGNMCGQHGMMDKGVPSFYDDLMRVPLLARLPGRIPAGATCAAFASSVDIAPTILDYLGAPPLAKAHGRSLRLAIGGADEADPAVFGERGDLAKPNLARLIRTRQWKLSLSSQGPKELYDLQQDPNETRNLAGDPARAPLIATLSARLLEHMRGIGDPTLPRFAGAGAPPAGASK